MERDKANPEYWSKYWDVFEIPKPIDISSKDINKYTYQCFHNFFSKHINSYDKGKSILEIGCGNSVWLPYFHQYFGLKVYGLDYSKNACERSREILKRHNIEGKIYEVDLFNPPSELLEKFDFVASFGVIEHFTNTTEVIIACSKFLKPGGKLITSIPNMAGFPGIYQKWMNKKIYDLHVPINKKNLINSINHAKLKNIECIYFMSCSVSATIESEYPTSFVKLKKVLTLFLSRFCKIIWIMEKYLKIKFPSTAFFSPYIVSIAQK